MPVEFPIPELPDLPALLQSLLRQIPRGRVATYGGLADALGCRTAARWVGEFLRNHDHSPQCGCHRVVRSDGSCGLFIGGNTPVKQRLLLDEGAPLIENRVDLERCRFDAFDSPRPLEGLIAWQTALSAKVKLRPLETTPEFVAALDVAYARPDLAIGAYILCHLLSGEVVWSRTIRRPVAFPYIPGFLTFRELPVHVELLRMASLEGFAAPLLFVDGNGILHPHGAGIATSVGVVAGVTTIGVGKKLLCGRIETGPTDGDFGRIQNNFGELIGAVVQSTPRSRPVYVSPGHDIDVASAAAIATLACRGHRLPEPLFRADALSKQAARIARSATADRL